MPASRTINLYSPSLGTLPETQGWLAFGAVGGSRALSTSGTTLRTSISPSAIAGYSNYLSSVPRLVNPSFPSLDRSQGFVLDFNLRLISELHQVNNRAGFSVTLLDGSSTPTGIELGFWTNSIFSQAGGSSPFTSVNERNTSINTTLASNYSLLMIDQSYYLLANNRLVLSGAVQSYSSWPKDSLLPYNPYTLPNFVFLGDNSRSAQGEAELGATAISLLGTATLGDDLINGSEVADRLNGLAGNDLMWGNGGHDTLIGGAGADQLNGGSGDDLLIGGSGADTFVFASGVPFRSQDLGVDTVADFNASEDRIQLSRATFTALPAGSTLPATAFATVGRDAAAASSSAVLVYNATTGFSFYNPNGSDPGFASNADAGGCFAQLWGGGGGGSAPALNSASFVVVP